MKELNGHKRAAGGFTLIEVMIVVAIVGILAAVAYPSFVSYLIRTDRSDGHSSLMAVQLAQERHRMTNAEYSNDLVDELGIGTTSSEGLYVLEIAEGPTRSWFKVTAKPAPGSRQNNDRPVGCRTLTLEVKGGSVLRYGATESDVDCW